MTHSLTHSILTDSLKARDASASKRRKSGRKAKSWRVESTSICDTAGQEHNTIKNDQIYKVIKSL